MPRCSNPRCGADYPPGSTQCTRPSCRCLLPEAVVAGRYRIETLIGLGGMGAVYRVNDTFEMKQVALKVLSLTKKSLDVPTSIERFRREAQYARQLHHKNIVPIVNFGQDGTLVYLAMPLITGGTLKALLKSELPLPTAKAQQYLNDLAEAVDAVHAHPQQIVHRDIKPSNLLIHQEDGRLVLTDFGIARAMQQEKALTQRGWSLGTEHYIAPEQERGNAEPTSDIYSMGVVAYQMFTGLLPFQAIVRNQAPRLPYPSTLNTSLPPTVDAVLLRALDMNPQKRYQSAHAFAAALNDALLPSTVALDAIPTLITTISTAENVIVRTIIPENPCANCGQENRNTSRFCCYCGHKLDETSPLVTEVCQVSYLSDPGRQAQENEDTLLVVQGLCTALAPPPRPFGLFAIADSLHELWGQTTGGHKASRLAVETIIDMLLPVLTTPSSDSCSTYRPGIKQSSEALPTQWLRDAVQQANHVIHHCNADYEAETASTLTVALMHKHRLYVASVGDSRAYHYSTSGGLHCITQSQHGHYLGQTHQVLIDSFQCEVEIDDLVLLCTDGLWVLDEQLTALLAQGGDLQHLTDTLVEIANDAGREGNASVIAVRVC